MRDLFRVDKCFNLRLDCFYLLEGRRSYLGLEVSGVQLLLGFERTAGDERRLVFHSSQEI